MTYYDYKVVPAPRRARKVKGVSAAQDLFALTLTETINEIARQGWEYYRSESMSAEAPAGWFKRAVAEEQTMLVFRKPREHLSPRLAAAPVESAVIAPDAAEEPRPAPAATERPLADRIQSGVTRREPSARREPRIGEAPPAASPMRPTPRLGPADQS